MAKLPSRWAQARSKADGRQHVLLEPGDWILGRLWLWPNLHPGASSLHVSSLEGSGLFLWDSLAFLTSYHLSVETSDGD